MGSHTRLWTFLSGVGGGGGCTATDGTAELQQVGDPAGSTSKVLKERTTMYLHGVRAPLTDSFTMCTPTLVPERLYPNKDDQ